MECREVNTLCFITDKANLPILIINIVIVQKSEEVRLS